MTHGAIALGGFALAVTACGRLGFDASAVDETPDAAADAPVSDASPTLGTFETPTVVPGLSNPAADDDPTVTADLLELYFSSNRDGGSDIFVSRRINPETPWPAPTPVDALNSNANDENPGISPDGLTIFLSSGRDGNLDIYEATRPNRNSPWSIPVPIEVINSGAEELGAQISADGRSLYFYRTANGDRELFVATRDALGQEWAAVTALTSLNSTADELSPHPSADNAVLFFVSNRTGGAGGRDIYTATRTGSGFSVEPIAELNEPGDDDDPWVSADYGYVVFSRGSNNGDSEILEAFRAD